MLRPSTEILADPESPLTIYALKLKTAFQAISCDVANIAGTPSWPWANTQALPETPLRQLFPSASERQESNAWPTAPEELLPKEWPSPDVAAKLGAFIEGHDIEGCYRAARWEARPPHLDREVGRILVRSWRLFLEYLGTVCEILKERPVDSSRTGAAGNSGSLAWESHNRQTINLIRLVDELFTLTKPPGHGQNGIGHTSLESLIDGWPNLTEAAKESSIPKSTLSDWAKKGWVKSFGEGHDRRFDPESIRKTREKRRPDE